jgi:hypothetical protein
MPDRSTPSSSSPASHNVAQPGSAGAIPTRPFGKTVIRVVHEAIHAGVTFLDNCWEYCNGFVDRKQHGILSHQELPL